MNMTRRDLLLSFPSLINRVISFTVSVSISQLLRQQDLRVLFPNLCNTVIVLYNGSVAIQLKQEKACWCCMLQKRAIIAEHVGFDL